MLNFYRLDEISKILPNLHKKVKKNIFYLFPDALTHYPKEGILAENQYLATLDQQVDKSIFLSDRVLDEDVNALLRFKGGGKGVLSISQAATGEENGLTLRVYAEQVAVKWAQENPNYLELYRYGEPRQTLTRGQGYLSEAAAAVARIPTGHPEGDLEAFATIYVGVVEATRRHIDGNPMGTEAYDFPTVYDRLRGMQFIYKAVESCENGSPWVSIY